MNNPLLNYQTEGEGEPLLIIHGLFGSSRNWLGHAKKLARDFRVIRIDLRNHGDSFHSPTMNYTEMADDVLRLLKSLGIKSAHVLGHSMGGKAAMMVCRQNPDVVRKLVVADIAPVAYQHDHDDLIQPILSMNLAAIKNRNSADEMLATGIPNKQIRLFLLQNLEIQRGIARWKVNWSALQTGMPAIVGYPKIDDWSVTNPCLFIRGENSDYVTSQHWSKIRKHFANASLVTLKNAGHWLHFEQPDAFYRSVSAFLTQE